MNVVLFDDPSVRLSLLPLTYTRPVAGVRVGILSVAEKWAKHLHISVSYLTERYLATKFPLRSTRDNLFINGGLCPAPQLVNAIGKLLINQGLEKDGRLLAVRTADPDLSNSGAFALSEYDGDVALIDRLTKLFKYNAAQIEADFELLTRGRTSAAITDPHTVVYGGDRLFVEEGATIKAAIINAENGSVYIGKNACVHEGAIIRGAFALCEGAHVNAGAKIRGDTTVGVFSKVGGEVSNSILFGYSNKGHDGFIGNTVIGEWCNLGADTNTSNLKNNYGPVRQWNYLEGDYMDTGEQFCGLVMGDHSGCSINTMFNTGTVVGVSANIFGSGFPPKFVPSFSWGGVAGFVPFDVKKADEVAERVMNRRNKAYDKTDQDILHEVFGLSETYRKRGRAI